MSCAPTGQGPQPGLQFRPFSEEELKKNASARSVFEGPRPELPSFIHKYCMKKLQHSQAGPKNETSEAFIKRVLGPNRGPETAKLLKDASRSLDSLQALCKGWVTGEDYSAGRIQRFAVRMFLVLDNIMNIKPIREIASDILLTTNSEMFAVDCVNALCASLIENAKQLQTQVAGFARPVDVVRTPIVIPAVQRKIEESLKALQTYIGDAEDPLRTLAHRTVLSFTDSVGKTTSLRRNLNIAELGWVVGSWKVLSVPEKASYLLQESQKKEEEKKA